jgi:Family of unknown function (DUF6308)
MSELTIWLAGKPITGVRDKLHRYCGLAWSGGRPEAWAFRFYDLYPDSEPNRLWATNLLVCSVLHPSITRANLMAYAEKIEEMERILSEELPFNTELADCGGTELEGLFNLLDLADKGMDLELLTKVLHTKRPRLIPLYTKHLHNRYRNVVATNGEAAWPELVFEFKKDLEMEQNRQALLKMQEEIAEDFHGDPISELRIADIALFMETRETSHCPV